MWPCIYRETLVAGHEVLKTIQIRDWGRAGEGVFGAQDVDLVQRFVECTGLGLECEPIVLSIMRGLVTTIAKDSRAGLTDVGDQYDGYIETRRKSLLTLLCTLGLGDTDARFLMSQIVSEQHGDSEVG